MTESYYHEQLDSMPVIIDEPGTYVTKSGVHVEVLTVNSGSGPFNVRGYGYVYGDTREPLARMRWHVCGAHSGAGPDPLDIIRKDDTYATSLRDNT